MAQLGNVPWAALGDAAVGNDAKPHRMPSPARQVKRHSAGWPLPWAPSIALAGGTRTALPYLATRAQSVGIAPALFICVADSVGMTVGGQIGCVSGVQLPTRRLGEGAATQGYPLDPTQVRANHDV